MATPATPKAAEQAAVLALTAASELEWHRAASLIARAGSARRLLAGQLDDLDWDERSDAAALASAVSPEQLDRAEALVASLEERGLGLVTILDDAYPANLRLVFDPPPFLLLRGRLVAADERALAVVAAPDAPGEALGRAQELAAGLARRGITVVCGLDSAVDAAVHEAALDAGGRAIALLATGLDDPQAARPRGLARRIAASGALVSPTWPEAPATFTSAVLRNAVMSGIALGLLAVWGDAFSEVRNQARRCLEHDKRLLLARPLVLGEPWAKHYTAHSGTTVVDGVDDAVEVVAAMVELRTQLACG
jgi:DNA processing protein